MAKTKPVVTIAAVDVQCACGEFIASPGGSLFFEASEYRPGEQHTCHACGAVVTLPRIARVGWK